MQKDPLFRLCMPQKRKMMFMLLLLLVRHLDDKIIRVIIKYDYKGNNNVIILIKDV